MKAKISFLESVQASSGSTYYKIGLEGAEYEGRRMITFTKDPLEVGQEVEWAHKENGDGSWVITPKKAFKPFGGGQAIDVALECLRMAVSLTNEGKVELEKLEQTAIRLKQIYSKL